MSHVKQRKLMRDLGLGGAGLDQSSGHDDLHQVLKAMVEGFSTRVVEGMRAGAPTTASTQATGSGTLAWRVNVAAGFLMVNGTAFDVGAQADFVVFNGATPVANGQSVAAVLIAKKDGTLAAVLGTAAATGSQQPPNPTQLQAAAGGNDAHAKPLAWAQVAQLTLNRTGDTTVTQSQDNTKRDFGVEITVE